MVTHPQVQTLVASGSWVRQGKASWHQAQMDSLTPRLAPGAEVGQGKRNALTLLVTDAQTLLGDWILARP